MTPLKVLVLGCSALSTGELTIVLEWARRCSRPIDLGLLLPSALAPHFAWAGTVVPYTTGARGGTVAEICSAVDTWRPDLFVVADLLLFHAAPHEVGASLEPVLHRAMAGCRVAALDLYDWDRRASYLECYGRARFASAAPIPLGVGRLAPSPYLAPRRSTPGIGRFAMMGDGIPLGAEERSQARRELGVEGRLVLTFTSPWQHVAQSLPEASGITRHFPALMLRLLDEAAVRSGPVTLVHLGPAPMNVPADVASLRYRHVAQMAPDRFRKLLGAADLVLGSNCIASSIVRGASMRVPAATLRLGDLVTVPVSRADATRPRRALDAFLRDAAPAYGFLVWPLGLREAMLSILEDNPFAAIQAHLDVLDPDAVVEGLARLLTDAAAADDLREAQARYFSTLAREMDEPDVALEAIL
jgi:hypothetical protein